MINGSSSRGAYAPTLTGAMGSWTKDARCASVDHREINFFDEESPRAVAKAKLVCKSCPVREACLSWALKWEQWGVWGSTTASERRRIRLTQPRRAYAG